MATENDNDLFSKLGVEMSDDKLNIDLNKTREFFDALKQTFENTAQNLQKDIAEGKVDMAENVGIKIDKENINIDLEKTKSFIESFGKKIESFVEEIEKSVKEIEKR
jgi:predicted nucleotidyltransferase